MSMPLWAAQPPVSVVAPAKVNLFLHITGRREDGYHLLESLFVFTTGGDRVHVSPSPEFRFTVSGPYAPALEALGGGGADNLVARAAHALAAHAGLEPMVAVELEKNLPVASGIGGGSADAAAALLALNEFWKLGVTIEALEPIALTLGADVPACLHGRPLMVRGIGEQLEPVSLGWRAGILLVNPGEGVSTPAIFRHFHNADTAFDAPLVDTAAVCASQAALASATHNSLQAPAIHECRAVAEVLSALEMLPGVRLVRMSGSGATCFALFEDTAAAQAAERVIKADHPGWWTMADEVGE